MSDEELLTLEQVAAILHITVRTVRSYIASGELPAVQLRRLYLVSRADLDIFIAQRKTRQKKQEDDEA